MREPPSCIRVLPVCARVRDVQRACVVYGAANDPRRRDVRSRVLHADCRNGASDATDKMISLFPLFFFSPLRGSNCEVSIMRGRWHRKHTRGFGGGMPGSAGDDIDRSRIGRDAARSRRGKPFGAFSKSLCEPAARGNSRG